MNLREKIPKGPLRKQIVPQKSYEKRLSVALLSSLDTIYYNLGLLAGHTLNRNVPHNVTDIITSIEGELRTLHINELLDASELDELTDMTAEIESGFHAKNWGKVETRISQVRSHSLSMIAGLRG